MSLKKILADGFFDAGEELDIALRLEDMAETTSIGDAVVLRDAAIDIRYMIGIIQEASKLKKRPIGIEPVFYKLDEVMKLTSLSNSTIYRMVSLNEMPSQIKIGSRSSGWVKAEIDNWVQSKIDNRG